MAVELSRSHEGHYIKVIRRIKGFPCTAPPCLEGLLRPCLLSNAPELLLHFLLISPTIWSSCPIPVSADDITSNLTQMREGIRQEGPPFPASSLCSYLYRQHLQQNPGHKHLLSRSSGKYDLPPPWALFLSWCPGPPATSCQGVLLALPGPFNLPFLLDSLP